MAVGPTARVTRSAGGDHTVTRGGGVMGGGMGGGALSRGMAPLGPRLSSSPAAVGTCLPAGVTASAAAAAAPLPIDGRTRMASSLSSSSDCLPIVYPVLSSSLSSSSSLLFELPAAEGDVNAALALA